MARPSSVERPHLGATSHVPRLGSDALHTAHLVNAAAFPSAATVELFRAAMRALGREQPLGRRTPRGVEALGTPATTGDPKTMESDQLAACAELRTALRALCDEARAESMRAEHLLVVFKETWFSLPEVRALDHDEQRGILLSRVLGLCLDEYYGMRR